MRLNFVMHPVEVLEEGIRRLGSAVQRYLEQRQATGKTSQPREPLSQQEDLIQI
jgi:hypothetical protein